MTHRIRRSVLCLVVCSVCLLPAVPAMAVIEAKNPLSQIYSSTAQTIVSGKVAKVDGDAKTLTITVTDALKGTKPGDTLAVTVNTPADLLTALKPDAPFLVFFAKGIALVHTDDRWFLARPAAGNAGLTITGPHATGSKDTFPGTTTALIAATKELSTTGKSTLLNALGDRTLNGPEREVARLPDIKNPTSFAAADINKDGKADLVICADKKPRIFIATDKGYEDQTEKLGLKDVACDYVVPIPEFDNSLERAATRPMADVIKDRPPTQPQGTPSLRLGDKTYMYDGTKYVTDDAYYKRVDDLLNPPKPPDDNPLVLTRTGIARGSITVKRDPIPGVLAAVVDRFDENDAYCYIAVTSTGLIRQRFEQFYHDPSSRPATQSSAVTADDLRLTGSKLTDYHEAHKKDGFKNPQPVVLDANGDGRQDLFLRADGGNLLLVNRGFGAFLVDPDAGKALTRKGLLAAAALKPNDKKQSLLLLTEDGTLFAVDTKSP